ncbi:hypothetical protein WR25_25277 [Diploscapter pachys]|uniref:Major facilitator superfamily (MFS) profile domain-containing protein n=1 Tax=Diploscapter pachys TaxID=2018661 RepID=A0A2A2LV35_9BILA|nr:hypothetical protein WR25_25277 [Diploscapter pachys]
MLEMKDLKIQRSSSNSPSQTLLQSPRGRTADNDSSTSISRSRTTSGQNPEDGVLTTVNSQNKHAGSGDACSSNRRRNMDRSIMGGTMPSVSAIVPHPKHRFRIVIFISTWLMLGSVMNCVDIFAFSMVYMESNSTQEFYVYNQEEKASLISIMAIGSLVGMYPQNKLLQINGARPILTASGMLLSILTFILPWALDNGYYTAAIIRFFQGVLYSADFGVVGLVCSRWSPLNEMGLALAALSGFTACRAVIQLPLAGWVISSYGWRYIYYVLAIILLVVTLCWHYLYRDFPEYSPFVSNRELSFIRRGKEAEQSSNIDDVPYNKIFTNRYVWAVWIAGFADIFASFMLVVFGAQYYHYLGLDIQANAWLNALKGILLLSVRFGVGCISEICKLRTANTVALQIPAFLLVFLGFLPREQPSLHVITITVYQALFGFNCAGFYKGGALISRQYSHLVISHIQLFKSLAVLLEPLVFSLIVDVSDENSPESLSNQWRLYFCIHAVCLTLANFVYLLWARVEPLPFLCSSTILPTINNNNSQVPDGNRELPNGNSPILPDGNATISPRQPHATDIESNTGNRS